MKYRLIHQAAAAADLDLLAELNRQLIQDEGHRNPMNLTQLRERMARWLATEYRAAIFEHERRVAAYALYRDDTDAIYLRHFFVARDVRRAGIGRMAMNLFLNEIVPPGMLVRLDVLVTNQPAQAFWQALGFAPYALTMERRG